MMGPLYALSLHVFTQLITKPIIFSIPVSIYSDSFLTYLQQGVVVQMQWGRSFHAVLFQIKSYSHVSIYLTPRAAMGMKTSATLLSQPRDIGVFRKASPLPPQLLTDNVLVL